MSDGDLSLFDAIYSQRAIRSFRPDPIPRAIVTRIVEAATKAPSGGNSQPWGFIAVQDPALRKELAVFARDGFQRMSERAAFRRQPGDPPPYPRLAPMIAAFEQIPLVIVACLVDAPGQYGSIYPAIQNLLLAARALNVGAVLTSGWAQAHKSEIKALLKLPENVEPVAYIPLGYPAREHYGPTTRRPVDDVLHWDRWTVGKPNTAATAHR